MSDLPTEAPPAAALTTAAPPPGPAVTVPTTAARPAPTGGGGVKETIESILVAFILAFVFRAFVVEAFVIPTGSMSTTLLGAHTRFHCPDCGYSFDLNYSSPTSGEDEDVSVPATTGRITTPIFCPNCGFQVPQDQVANPPIAYGDRILVLKYLYLLQHPKRWDVVVFKAPEKPNQNYIKRLTGLPGESVMILDGDVYVRPAGDPDPKHFVVQTKPPAAQSAMWRLVYDNDYHPEGHLDRGGYPWQQPWRVAYGTGCRQDDPVAHGRAFTFDTPHAGVKLNYEVLANPSAQGFTDYLVCNQNTHRFSIDPQTHQLLEGPLSVAQRYPEPGWVGNGDLPVSDLDVRLTYERSGGDGAFQIAMTKRGDTFTAELTPTMATLYHDVNGRRTAVGSAPLPAGRRPVRVELSNADYQATLRINDAVAARTTQDEYHPDLPALLREYNDQAPPPLPAVSLRADDQQSRVSHLSLWRDVYYYDRGVSWATPADFPNKAQVLGPDEYFTMGDNSQLSWDARCWLEGVHFPAERLDADPGKVPGRFLLGKAFYVYWPAGYKAADWLPSFVPNFAGMRMIR